MPDQYRIRLARPDDIPLIPPIERAADGLYATTPYAHVIASFGGITEQDCAEAQDRWRLWVAADAGDLPVGFAELAMVDDETMFLTQVSVSPAHARRGLGRRLITAGESFYGDRGVRRITLTTFRDIPWNAPYYERLGFRVIPDHEADADPYIGRRLRRQVGNGLRRDSRVAMVRELARPHHIGAAR